MTDEMKLGGRLPLLDPKALKPEQKTLYDQIDETLIPWATKAGFEGKTDEGRFIGPFNPFLYSPDVAAGFLKFMKANSEHTTLSKRVQEVVILSVGAIWKSHYELYAHSALARQAGLSESAIAALTAGGASDDLLPEEVVAHRFARQMVSEHRVDADLYNETERAFGRDGLVDLTFLMGIYLYTCVTLNAFEVPVPPQVSKPAAK